MRGASMMERTPLDSTKELRHSIYSKSDEIKMKYEFYYIALTFTILGLSLQTSKVGNLPYDNFITYICIFSEFFSWLLLLTSGLCGLVKLSYANDMLRHSDFMRLGMNNGEHSGKYKELFDKHEPKHICQRKCFMGGVTSLVISRILEGGISLYIQ